MSWKILQENLFTLTQQSIQVQTAGLYCVFNALGYWNPNIAANTRYKYTSYFRFGSLRAQVHIKMHFSGQQKHISPFAELNAGYVTWVNIKCAWTITAPQQTQAWSQNEKDNYYICILYLYIVYLYTEFMCQAMRKISIHVSVLLKQHCLLIWYCYWEVILAF